MSGKLAGNDNLHSWCDILDVVLGRIIAAPKRPRRNEPRSVPYGCLSAAGAILIRLVSTPCPSGLRRTEMPSIFNAPTFFAFPSIQLFVSLRFRLPV